MGLILAIDQSTSATKAVLFDARGEVIDKASQNHKQIYPQPGWVEHDVEGIWSSLLNAVYTLAQRNRDRLGQIEAVSITNQRETVVVFDAETHKPLHNALVWQDRRGDSICQTLSAQGYENAIRQKTGLKIDTYFSASKIRWLLEQRPSIAAKLKSGEALIGTMDTYLIHRLTDGQVFATDHTNASRTLLFDIGRLKWDSELCELFRVPMKALAEVRASSARFGKTDIGGLLPGKVPIIGVMGDSQASLFAQRCYYPGMAKATFGTGTSVLLNIGDRFRVSNQGAVTALAWVWQKQPTYAIEGLINYSAATIEWLKNQLGLIADSSEVEELALSVKDSGGVYLVPAFAGLSAPYWSPQARAAIFGMTAFTGKAHVVRAAQEAIAYQIREVLGMMQGGVGVTPTVLYADGGPTKNRFLMQFTADLTRMDINVSEVAESSAWGAAMNALLGLGVYRSLAELEKIPRPQVFFSPRMDSVEADKMHTGWQNALKRVL